MNAQPQSHSRVGYVGGANVAGVLGISPFRTPLDEYLLISGEREEVISERQAEFFEDRRDLEPWAAKKFTRKTGLRIVRTNQRYDDASFPWAKAEIDAEASDGGNVETKSVNSNAVRLWGRPEDEDEPPMYVTAQAMWGMGVHPAPHCYVNALIGFDDHRVFRVERDDELIAEIRHRAERFWKFHIVPRRPPPPTNVEDLLRLYSRDTGRAVEADAETRTALEALITERRALKLHESMTRVHEFHIKSYMRDATTLLVHGQPAITWKSRADGVRVFRIR